MTGRSDHTGALEQRLRALCDGFDRELADRQGEVLFGGEPTTFEAVRSKLEAALEAFAVVHQAQRELQQALADRRRAMPGARSIYGDAVVFLRHTLGKDSPRLPLFGLRPPKPRTPLTADQAAIAHAKAARTRAARGTLGTRQRRSIGREPKPVVVVQGLGEVAASAAEAGGVSKEAAHASGAEEPPHEGDPPTGTLCQSKPAAEQGAPA